MDIANGDGNNGGRIRFINQNYNAELFYVDNAGNGRIAGTLAQGSDYRLKRNVTDLNGADVLRRFMATRFVEYLRVEQDFGNRQFAGVLAHEAQAQFPNAVTGIKDAVRPAIDDPSKQVIDPQSVDYAMLSVYFGAALQEAVRRIEALEAMSAHDD
ncbi:hypothetical protein WM27_20930 [Burkholderia ubonensis]|nr:hypothetical protein WM27_20930 [Burkholderia ubonensis]ODQ31058.1 hypothetical protein BGV65_18650 [Burkholderia ubonensis]